MTTDAHRLNLSAAAASITVALVLIAIKTWAQIETGALSIVASLVDSVLDLMIAGANLAAMLYAARPADDDHTFGHTAAEDIVALAQAAIVGVSGLLIFYGGVRRLFEPVVIGAETTGIAVMLAALVLTGALVWWQKRVARRTGSRIVDADSAHYISDFAPNLAAIVALGASKFLGVVTLDSVLAMAAALWILRTAWRIGSGAIDGLMDREAPVGLVSEIAAIARAAPGIRGFHDLRTRMSGTRLFVQLHVEIDGDLPLREAHDIGERLRREILKSGRDIDVIIHTDPV